MGAAWQPAPIVGGAYSDDTRPWSVQDTVNWIPVNIERPGGRSDSLLRCAPGASVFSIPGPAAPVRGMHDVEGRMFAVVGTSLYQLTPAGVAIRWGEIPGVGMVSMAHNQITGGNELVIASGSSGYVLNTVTEQFGQITDDGFPGFKVCDFSDGYIVGVEPQGRFWFHSDLAAATEYNTLDRYEAESQPDRIVSLIVSHREVLVLGERTGEFFRNTEAAQGTFQRIDGTEMEVGCAATHSARKLDNSVFWLGNDGSVYRLNGYSPIRISTHAMEQAISRCNLAQAFAFTYEDCGHKIYYLTFPDGVTWGYDVATQEWTRRESFGLERWRMSSMVRSNRQWFAGDYANGKVYRIDWSMPWENGEVIERRRISGVLHDNQNRVGIDAIEFVLNMGEGNAGPGDLFPPQPRGPEIRGSAPDGVVGTTYAGFTYVLTPGDSPIVRTRIVGGVLPDGLSWNESTASISAGDPTISGSFSITLRAQDANGLWSQHEDTIHITLPGVACGIPTQYAGGQSFPTTFDVTLGSGTGTVTLDYLTGANPDRFVVTLDGVDVIDTGYVGNPDYVEGGQTYQQKLDAYMLAHGLPQEDINMFNPAHVDGNPNLDTNPGTMHASFVKSTTVATATLKIYGPLPGTGWSARLGCPV